MSTPADIPKLRQSGDRKTLAATMRVALLVILFEACLLSHAWGAASNTDVIGALIAGTGVGEASARDLIIVWDIRLPRTATAPYWRSPLQ